MTKPETNAELAQLEAQIAALRGDIARMTATLADIAGTSTATLRAGLTNQARNNPLQTLAIVGGVGLLVGLILARR